MRILFVCVSDPTSDPRVRKELQHLRSRGFDDIGVMALYTPREENVVCWHDGFVDGCPLFRVNSRAASLTREAVLGLKPDVVHVHELDALWSVLTTWSGENVQKIESGSAAADSGVSVERLPMRLIYEAHEYERGRYNVSDERIKRTTLVAGIADEVIVVSPAIVDEFEKVFGVRPHMIPNSFKRRPIPKRTGRDVAFCGNVTVGRGLDILGEAMRLLRGRKLVVFGAVKDEAVAADLSRGNDVEFMGRAPYPYPHEPDSLIERLSTAVVGINLVDLRVESYRMALPNKLFEYGFAGVRVVSNPQKDVVDLTHRFDLGSIADVAGCSEYLEADAPRLATAISMAMDAHPKTQEFIDEWCWEETGAKVLDSLYL